MLCHWRSNITGGCALYWGLVEENEIPKVLDRLLAAITEQDFHLTFGILGAKYVLNSLLQYDQAETAYALLTQRSYPSWGYWIDQGATTLWESWEGTTSRNHIMFGDISDLVLQSTGRDYTRYQFNGFPPQHITTTINRRP